MMFGDIGRFFLQLRLDDGKRPAAGEAIAAFVDRGAHE